jgi:hypothetical protein
LSLAQQEWLADQLGPNLSIKDFVKHLLVQAFVTSKGGASVNAA